MHICDNVFIACRIPTPHIHIFQWANVWKWGTWTVCPNFWHGWWYTDPSEKYDFVSWDDEIPNIWKKDPTHQPDHLFYLWTNTVSAGLIRLPTGNQTWFDGKSAVFFQGFPSRTKPPLSSEIFDYHRVHYINYIHLYSTSIGYVPLNSHKIPWKIHSSYRMVPPSYKFYKTHEY